MSRVSLLVAFIGLCAVVLPSFSKAPLPVASAETSASPPGDAPCGCGNQREDPNAWENASPVALQTTANDVCLAYVWANHGSYCSWYAMRCGVGPLNVNTTNCGTSGNCGTPAAPGCIQMAAALPTAFASTDPFLNDPLHPSHQGYKGDKKDKQDKPGKPKDKHLTVVEKTLEHDHLWVPYTTAVGQKWIHAKIFKYDVSHELVSEQGTFYIGYEINKPTPNDPLEIKPEDVTVAGPYCVTVNYEGHPIDIILHEDSQKGKVP